MFRIWKSLEIWLVLLLQLLCAGLSAPFLDFTDPHVQAECCVYDRIHCQLSRFGFSDFRPGQLEAVLSILHGNDVFVRVATGCGKSLCMFLPPLVHGEKAAAIIISPLVGLMDEQVRSFWKGVHASYLLWPRCTSCMAISCQLSVLVRVTARSMKMWSTADTDMVWEVLSSKYN